MNNCPICGKPEDVCTCGCICKPCPEDGNRLGTPNYNLLLYRASDVTSWLTDFNNTMMKIDSIMHGLALRTNTIDSVPEELVSTVEELSKKMQCVEVKLAELTSSNQNLASQVTNMSTTVTTIQQDVATLMINFNNVDTRVTTAESAIQNLQMNLAKLTENLNSLTESVATLNTWKDETNDLLDELQASDSGLQAEIDKLDLYATRGYVEGKNWSASFTGYGIEPTNFTIADVVILREHMKVHRVDANKWVDGYNVKMFLKIGNGPQLNSSGPRSIAVNVPQNYRAFIRPSNTDEIWSNGAVKTSSPVLAVFEEANVTESGGNIYISFGVNTGNVSAPVGNIHIEYTLVEYGEEE